MNCSIAGLCRSATLNINAADSLADEIIMKFTQEGVLVCSTDQAHLIYINKKHLSFIYFIPGSYTPVDSS